MIRMGAMAVAAVIASAGCSSSSSDESRDTAAERQERMQGEQERMRAEAEERERQARVEQQSAEQQRAEQQQQQAEQPSMQQQRAEQQRAADQPGGAEGADNTGINERDRDGVALTPLDQSNDRRDIQITQAIRKMVIDDEALSFDAKNVKIITNNGKVTLRGPVDSTSERAKIESSARRVAGVRQVDNQLEIKK